MDRRFLTLILSCAALGGCNADSPEELESQRAMLPETPGTSRVHEMVGNSLVPVDTTPQESTLLKSGERSRLVKAPALRRATRDEIEDYNGTFRTEGSRDRLLGRIKSAPNEHARWELVDVFGCVTRNLSPETRSKANAKLAAVLQAVNGVQPPSTLPAVQAKESVVGR